VELEIGAQRFAWEPERGGRLVSWCVDDLELLGRNGDEPIAYGMYPMAPWAGRVAHNTIRVEDAHRLGVNLEQDFVAEINDDPWAIHGTCFTDPVDDMGLAGNVVRSRQRIARWPWRAELIAEWTIHANGFTSQLTLVSEEPSPVILGWHPWFRKVLRGATAEWSMASAVMAVRRDAFPTGEWRAFAETVDPYDDVFRSPSCSAHIHWPGVMSLTIGSSRPWFVVYDEPAETLCVEPQTNIPNAFRAPHGGEVDIARAGSPVTLTNRWMWERL
jgi:aldose 1-epimerase